MTDINEFCSLIEQQQLIQDSYFTSIAISYNPDEDEDEDDLDEQDDVEDDDGYILDDDDDEEESLDTDIDDD